MKRKLLFCPLFFYLLIFPNLNSVQAMFVPKSQEGLEGSGSISTTPNTTPNSSPATKKINTVKDLVRNLIEVKGHYGIFDSSKHKIINWSEPKMGVHSIISEDLFGHRKLTFLTSKDAQSIEPLVLYSEDKKTTEDVSFPPLSFDFYVSEAHEKVSLGELQENEEEAEEGSGSSWGDEGGVPWTEADTAAFFGESQKSSESSEESSLPPILKQAEEATSAAAGYSGSQALRWARRAAKVISSANRRLFPRSSTPFVVKDKIYHLEYFYDEVDFTKMSASELKKSFLSTGTRTLQNLKVLHDIGWAHLDIKTGNIRPDGIIRDYGDAVDLKDKNYGPLKVLKHGTETWTAPEMSDPDSYLEIRSNGLFYKDSEQTFNPQLCDVYSVALYLYIFKYFQRDEFQFHRLPTSSAFLRLDLENDPIDFALNRALSHNALERGTVSELLSVFSKALEESHMEEGGIRKFIFRRLDFDRESPNSLTGSNPKQDSKDAAALFEELPGPI